MKIAIRGKKLFTGLKVIENGVVLINGNKIVKIASSIDQSTIVKDYKFVDFPECTVLPGLVDAHSHFSQSAQKENYAAGSKDHGYLRLIRGVSNIRLDLLSGVTTLRCLGEREFIDVAIKEATERKLIPGPRLLISGKAIKSSYGHGLMGTAFDGSIEVKKAARVNILEAGADQLKIFVSGSKGEFKNYKFSAEKNIERNEMQCLMTLEEMNEVVEVAHSVGKKVAAHCYGGIGLKRCIEAGVDTIEHGIYMDDEDIKLMLENKTWLTLTFSGYFSDKRLENRGTPELTKGFVKFRNEIRNTYKKVVFSGIRYSLGTDGMHGELAYELESLVQLGVKPFKALKAVTSEAAALCNVEDKIGTIEPNKFADIIVVKGDPLVNISDIKKIVAIYKDGERIDNLSSL